MTCPAVESAQAIRAAFDVWPDGPTLLRPEVTSCRADESQSTGEVSTIHQYEGNAFQTFLLHLLNVTLSDIFDKQLITINNS